MYDLFDKDGFMGLNWDYPSPLNIPVIFLGVALLIVFGIMLVWGVVWFGSILPWPY